MSVSLRGLNRSSNSDTLNAISCESFSTISPGASVPSTTVQAALVVPTAFKVRHVAVMFAAIDATAGADSFNIVLGGLPGQTAQAYAQGNAAQNTVPTGPVVSAVIGQSLFAADVPFNAANTAASNTQGVAGDPSGRAVPNTGWLSITTTGGYGLFVPTNYDAAYPAATPLSLRVTTPSGGSITGLSVVISVVPIALRHTTASVAGQGIVLPATDF